MKAHENQPATGKTGFPGGGGLFTPKALKCPSGPAGAAARLVPRDVDLYKHSMMVGESLETFGVVPHHKTHETTQSCKMDFAWHSKLWGDNNLILCDCICRVIQSKSLRQQHKSSEALMFLYIYLSHELAADKSWSFRWGKPLRQKFSGQKTPGKSKGHGNGTLTYNYSHHPTLVIWITALIMTKHLSKLLTCCLWIKNHQKSTWFPPPFFSPPIYQIKVCYTRPKVR